MRYIKKNEKAVRSSVASSFCVKMVNVVRNKAIVRMEFALAFWIQDIRKKNIQLDTKMIRKKAQNSFSKSSGGTEGESQPGPSSSSDADEFQASKGWLDWLVKRHQLLIGKFHGEAASADTKSAEKYPEIFDQLIKEKGHKPEQVSNMDETVLFWKKIRSRTFPMKDEIKAP